MATIDEDPEMMLQIKQLKKLTVVCHSILKMITDLLFSLF